ncbi:MAG TPA: hypothetical protein VGD59_00300 [Acidisarcina sp.]
MEINKEARQPLPSTTRNNQPLLPFAVLACFAIFWTGFIAFFGPDFGGVDAYIFRDAGCNYAAGRGFVAASLPNNVAIIPAKLFAAYPPGSPLLFAPVAYLFGCGPLTGTFYNLALLTLLGAMVVCYLPPGTPARPQRLIGAAIVGATLPGGLFITDLSLDRPEPLSLLIFFLLLKLWSISTSTWSRALLTGASGLVFLVEPYVGVTSWLLLAALTCHGFRQPGRLRILSSAALITLGTIAVWLTWIHHLDPDSINRLMSHAVGSNSGAGLVLRSGGALTSHAGPIHIYSLLVHEYSDRSRLLRVMPLVALFCSFVVLGVLTPRTRNAASPGHCARPLLVFAAILLLFPLLIFPGQPNYFAASTASLFAVVAVGRHEYSEQMRRGSPTLLLLAIAALSSFPALILSITIKVEQKNEYSNAAAQAARIKQEFTAKGYKSPRVLVDALHYFLYKPYLPDLYNSAYVASDDPLTRFDGVVQCYMKSTSHGIKDQDYWELIDSSPPPTPLTLLGRRARRSVWYWSCDVYARKRASPSPGTPSSGHP